jgi:hypothetical protein
MKQAFDEFMQQEPELQAILTKKRSAVAHLHQDSKSANNDNVELDTMSFGSDVHVTGVKAPAGGNIVQLVNSMLDNTGVSTPMQGKRHLDDRTYRIKLEDIVDPQLRRIMVLVYECNIEAEKVLSPSAPANGVIERATNTEETVYALVMINILAISYAGLTWKTEKEKTAKILSYDATRGQNLQQFLPSYIWNRMRH